MKSNRMRWIGALAVLLTLLTGCSTGTRRAPAGESAGAAELKSQTLSYVGIELGIRYRLRALSDELGAFLYSSAEALQSLESRIRANKTLSTKDYALRTEIQKVQALEHERAQAESQVASLFQYAGDAVDRALFRFDVSKYDFNETQRFPVEVERTHRLEQLSDLEGEIRLDPGSSAYRLELENRLPPAAPGQEPPKLSARLHCDRPVSIKLTAARDLNQRSKADFTLYNRRVDMASAVLVFPAEPVNCSVQFSSKALKSSPRLVIRTEDRLLEDSLNGKVREICLSPTLPPDARDAVDSFITANYQNISCAQKVADVDFLSDPIDALNRKMLALTGSPLPPDVVDRQDPDHDPDFTRAPKLDVIVLSALEFKNDFYGTQVARALRKQAARGAVVRILVPGISALLGPKDKKLLSELERSSPNVQVQRFEYDRFSIHRFHRNVHAKIFVTLSRTQPEANLVITGGRNIKDTFAFYNKPDYSKVPAFVHYGKEEPYAFYWDLEVLIRDRAVAQQVAAQVLAMMNRDRRSLAYRPTTLHVPAETLKPSELSSMRARLDESPHVRHLISLPYVDDRQMEKLFVDMIDGATHSVRIVTPYFNPRKEIVSAMRRAGDRGVKIELITGLELAGDNVPAISDDVNKAAVNRFYRAIHLRTWVEPKSILHLKTLLVDGRLLYVGGTNLNQRSFTHDIESGFVITSQAVATRFNALFDSVYAPNSNPINERQKISLLNRLLLGLGKSFF